MVVADSVVLVGDGQPRTVHVDEVEDDSVGPAEADLDFVLSTSTNLGDGGRVVLRKRKTLILIVVQEQYGLVLFINGPRLFDEKTESKS